jgi:transposase
MVLDDEREYNSQWAAIVSTTKKIGCSPEALRRWRHRAEIDAGRRNRLPAEESSRIKELERENRRLQRANELLPKASAFLAQAEPGRRVPVRLR